MNSVKADQLVSKLVEDQPSFKKLTQGYTPPPPVDRSAPSVDDIMRYENGEMDDDEVVAFFQKLVNSGMIRHLQGSYGRMAQCLLDQGLIHRQ